MDVRTSLDMGGEDVSACIRIGVNIGINGSDHQMHVHDGFDVGAERFDGRGSEGQVRNKMTVHDIDVDPIGPLILDGANFGAKIGKICG